MAISFEDLNGVLNLMNNYALEVSSLSKTFDRPAVNNLSFSVHGGEFYALLGPNGAGKTTSLRMVAGSITSRQRRD